MINTMQGTAFSAVFIANILGADQLSDIRAEYELLYSKLVPFLKSDLTFSESSSDGITKTLSESLSSTLTKSKSSALSAGTSESKSHTEGRAITNTDTVSISHTEGLSQGVHAGADGIGVSAGHHSSTTAGYSHSIARTKSWSDTTTFGTTKTQTNTIGDSEAKGEIKSIADGKSLTETTGRSLQISYINKTVQNLLDRIDEQLERLKEGENYGIFASAAYFLAADPMATKMLAMRGPINQGPYSHIMEKEIKDALNDGKEVHVHVDVEYDGDSQRPSKIRVTYNIDGKDTVMEYDNDEGSTDLLDSVEDKVDEEQYNDLKNEIDEANADGAKMSIIAVKTEYDENGNITKVTIIMRDDNAEHPQNEPRVLSPKEVS